MNKKKVLFICTHNSARSQMAEGILRYLYGDRYEVFSAGTEPSGIHPSAVKVMEEMAIDVSSHTSKRVDSFLNMELDYIITVCDNANEACPFFLGGKECIHKGFRDPAVAEGEEVEVLDVFRQVRDEIKEWIETTFG